MTINVSRRGFLKLGTAGLATSSMAAMGFAPEAEAASIRPFKLTHTKETRGCCTYCSVGCGLIIYSRGDKAKNVNQQIIHIEGDPDHPVSRGALCPKGAGILDYIKSPARVKFPEVREAGSSEWKRISWDDAIKRIARHMKNDRDKNFVTVDEQGRTVNQWTTTGMLAASAGTNETGYLTHKIVRSLGMLAFDNQARV